MPGDGDQENELGDRPTLAELMEKEFADAWDRGDTSLSEEEARSLAEAAIKKHQQLDPNAPKVLSEFSGDPNISVAEDEPEKVLTEAIQTANTRRVASAEKIRKELGGD